MSAQPELIVIPYLQGLGSVRNLSHFRTVQFFSIQKSTFIHTNIPLNLFLLRIEIEWKKGSRECFSMIVSQLF